MAASAPSLADPTPNRDVVAVHRHLINEFEPATKQLADAGLNLFRALNGTTQAAKDYSRALHGLAMVSQRGQPTSREFGDELSQIKSALDKITEQHDETMIEYNKLDSKDLKEMANTYTKEEKALIKRVQKGSANGDTLARFYQENQINALEQERRRYHFLAEKHREWVASYADMFQKLSPVAKEATRPKVAESPEEAANNQAAPPTTFTPPDVDSSISLSRSASQSSTEAPPYTNDQHGDNGNIAFVSMMKRDSVIDHQPTPLNIPVEQPPSPKQYNGNHGENDQNKYSEIVKPKKQNPPPPPPPVELPQANVMPAKQDIVMKPATAPRTITAPPPPSPPSAAHQKILYVVHDFVANSNSQLSIYAGDRIRLQKSGTQGWAFGENLTTHKTGWFPQGFAQEAFTA